MKKTWLIIAVLAMAFSSVAWAETSYFCKTGSVTSTTYPIKITASGGTSWCAVCRVASGAQNAGEYIIKKGDPLSADIVIQPSSFYLMEDSPYITSAVYRTSNSVRASVCYSCCQGVVSWMAQLYTTLPANSLKAGKKYQILFNCSQSGIPVGGVTLEGQQHYSPYNPLGLWEYIQYPADSVVRSYASVPFVAKTCPGTQRIDFALSGKPGPVNGWFMLVGPVTIREVQ